MSAAVKVEAPKAETKPHLVGAVFNNAIQFAGVTNSVSLERNCVSIQPARLEPDGSAVAVTTPGERSDGLLLKRGSGPRFQQSFIPWANVNELQYG